MLHLYSNLKNLTMNLLLTELESCKGFGKRLQDNQFIKGTGFCDEQIESAINTAADRIKEYLLQVREAAQVPQELIDIQKHWVKRQYEIGEGGTCVLSAGFSFSYKSKDYFMPPNGPFQGCLSWEKCKDEIEILLRDIGAENIVYYWGNMD